MKDLICTECGRVIEFDETNYGTPELPCCIQCNADAEFKTWLVTGKAITPGMKAWVNYLKS